ncbi:MAG: TlpA family protein disulfide reductase [Pedobacter sp.]|nr:MAG: TlpA family protein disulfide reductase [Pedobacter sp.]
MKFLLTCFLLSVTYNVSLAQDTVRSSTGKITSISSVVAKKTDTTEVAYFEGKALKYYQYMALVRTGDYTLRKDFKPGSDRKLTLFKLSAEEAKIRNERIAKLMGIKSPILQPLTPLNTTPLFNDIKRRDLEGKVIVLIFWYADCSPCTDSFADINRFITDLNEKNIAVITITKDNKESAKLKLGNFKIAKHIYNASSILNEYKLNTYPSIVVTDKNHVIQYAVTGLSSLKPFETEVTKQLGR